MQKFFLWHYVTAGFLFSRFFRGWSRLLPLVHWVFSQIPWVFLGFAWVFSDINGIFWLLGQNLAEVPVISGLEATLYHIWEENWEKLAKIGVFVGKFPKYPLVPWVFRPKMAWVFSGLEFFSPWVFAKTHKKNACRSATIYTPLKAKFSKNFLALSKIFQVDYPLNPRTWDYHFQMEVVPYSSCHLYSILQN